MKKKLIKLGLSIILFIVALILASITIPLSILFVLYRTFLYYKRSTPIGYLTYVFYALSVAIDVIGNVIAGPLFNFILLKKESRIYFGNIYHTISLILDANFRKNHLNKKGLLLYNVIEFFDPGHFDGVKKSYEDTTLKTIKYFY
jgi:hypothetical protein